ncbi:MAG: TspO/MBR family protein [Methanoregulaceae archaeon]
MDDAIMNRNSLLTLVGAIVLCNLAGLLGSLVTITGSGSWYESLVKPAFNPPSWVFAPAWTTLYILMGIALFLVIMEGRKGSDVRIPLVLFGIQLVLNAIWSFAFFGLESPLAGVIVILLLWVFIAATMVTFYPVRKLATVLLIPYILWVSFASVLNYSIYILNP